MRNILIWDAKLGYYDAVNVSDFDTFVNTRFVSGTSWYTSRGKVYLRLVDDEQVKVFGSIIEVGYVLEREVSAKEAWDLIINEREYRQG